MAPKFTKRRQRDDHDPLENTRKKRKQNANKTRPETVTGKAHPKQHKVNPLKSRIRDLKRLLSKVENMPADVRVGHERELAHLERDLEVEQQEVGKSDAKKNMFAVYKKYKMVRFFDRQKAERRLKKLIKSYESAEDPTEKERLEQEKHEADVDVHYTIYHPLGKAYNALYPSKKGGFDENKRTKGDAEVWHKVEELMPQGKDVLEKYRRDVTATSHTPTTATSEKALAAMKNHEKSKKTDKSTKKHQHKIRDTEEAGDAEDGLEFFE